MVENPPLSTRMEQQRITQAAVVVVPLSPLWTQLEPHNQRQIAQLLAELIRRIQLCSLNLEANHHEP